MLPATFSLQAAAIAAGAALLLGLAGGGAAVHGWYSPRLEAAELRERELGNKVDEQNRAVESLKEAADERQRQAEKALAAAQAAAKAYETSAQRILGTQKPAGANECAAAQWLLQQELRK
jgi:hypothetical protein